MKTRDVYVKFEVCADTDEAARELVQPYVEMIGVTDVEIVNDPRWRILRLGGSVTGDNLVEAACKAHELNTLGERLIAHRNMMKFLSEKPEQTPIDMVLHCPACGVQHIDAPEGGPEIQPDGTTHIETAWANPPHKSHLCHECGHIWRPADVATNGVEKILTAGKKDTPVASAIDWREVADKLKEGLKAAINYGKFRGMMMDMDTGIATGMWGYLADHLEAHPSIKVDREMLGLNSRQLTKLRRDRRIAELESAKQAINIPASPTTDIPGP